jgi:hypothetical protein
LNEEADAPVAGSISPKKAITIQAINWDQVTNEPSFTPAPAKHEAQ